MLTHVESRLASVLTVGHALRLGARAARVAARPERVLSCRQGTRLASTAAEAGECGPTNQATAGACVALTYPESSEVAYYWRDGAFVEIWLAD